MNDAKRLRGRRRTERATRRLEISAASKSATPSEPPVEAELHPSRDEVMAILGAVAEAVTVQDVSGQLIYANDAAARIRGIGARTVPSVAGGICQVATTLFQRVFWSGFPLIERRWHLYWIPAYTSRGVVGLDATVDEDAGLDFRWSNPTDGYVLIQAATDETNVYFGLYGKP